jgi:hypothetical protein
MSSRPGRVGAATTLVALLVFGFIAPSASASASASDTVGDQLGARGSSLQDGEARAASSTPIRVRDLDRACPPGRVPTSGFADVPRGSAFSRATDCLVWYGVTQGTTATTYAPNASVPRRQMAVFLHRLLDDLVVLPDPPAISRFRDVAATGEAGRAINVLASPELAELLGVQVVAGRTADTFDPNARVTRAQMGSFVNRVLEGVAAYYGAAITRGNCGDPARPDVGCFPDEAAIAPAHRANVAALFRIGVVTGRSDGTYGPVADVTRGQMAAFLARLLDVFVAAEVTVPPDRFADVHVDAGSAAAPCTPGGRDGSREAPLCSIQAGIDRARTLDGYVVSVVVAPLTDGAYEGSVVLSSGQAFSVDLVADGFYVPIDGTVRVEGSSTRAANAVVGFSVQPAGPDPAVDVRTNGAAFVVDNELLGTRGLVVDQSGATLATLNEIDVTTIGIDLTRTSLGSTSVVANRFYDPTDVYVRVPAGTPRIEADATLRAWRADNVFPAAPRLADDVTGRRALLPAG